MIISCSTYSFQPYFVSGSMTQLESIGKAKEIGFEAIEIVDIIPHDGSTREDYALKLKNEARKQNIAISNFTFGADFLNGHQGDVDAEIQYVKEMIDLAEILGAKSVRHDATTGYPKGQRGYRGFDDALPLLAECCRSVTKYAQAKGIQTMVENHGFFSQDSCRVEQLVNAVAHDNFGLLVDMGNFLCADEDPAVAVGRVAPYAFYAHAKDFHIKNRMLPNPGDGFFQSRNGTYLRGAIIGHGDVPVVHCLAALKQAGFSGYLAIEFEGIEDPALGLKIGLANLTRYLSLV